MANFEITFPLDALLVKCQHADCTLYSLPQIDGDEINHPKTYGTEFPWRVFKIGGKEFLYCGKHARELQAQLDAIMGKVR